MIFSVNVRAASQKLIASCLIDTYNVSFGCLRLSPSSFRDFSLARYSLLVSPRPAVIRTYLVSLSLSLVRIIRFSHLGPGSRSLRFAVLLVFLHTALTYTPSNLHQRQTRTRGFANARQRDGGLNVVLIAKAGRIFLKCDVRWKRHAEPGTPPGIVNHVPLELPGGNYSLNTRESTERRASRE